MKKLYRIRCLAMTALCAVLVPQVQAASLLEVYQQALQSDPLIHESDARRLAASELAPQARGLLFPQIAANASYSTSQSDGTQLVLDENSVTRPSFSSDLDTNTWDIGLRQSIFRWDQVVGLKQANKLVARAEADYEAAQQDLMIRVATRYFEVLGAEDVLTSIHANRLAIARQLEQAKQRFEVGLIAITDVQESQAAHDQAVADEISAKRSLATAREFLREITGEYVASLAAPTNEFPLVSPNPADETSWVDLAMSQNLTVISSRLSEQVARDEIAFRRTGHYPTIDLVAGRRFNEQTGDQIFTVPPNPPAVTPADTDFLGDSISLQISLPIFTGGRTSSRVREAVYLHRASREQLQRVARETERQTRDAYLGVLAEISRVQALKQAVESSRTALEATEAGFEVGTRTIVDVLNSQFAVYAAITNYYRSRYAYIGNVLRLKQAAGMLQVQDLEEIDRWLSERKPPEQAISEEGATADPG
ncbi:MAG TPA: TolC family outer membrane protein [Woeseiaceae bacterium]|jgi:outer membrane protein